MKYDLIAYIGRFQPFHNGHKAVVEYALKNAERVALVIGSDGGAPNPKNPWTTAERITMIRSCFPVDEAQRLVFIGQRDYPYNHDRWLAEVSSKISGAAMSKFKANPYKIGLVGLNKDDTSFYLRHFPQFESVPFTPEKIINATDIRYVYFDVNPDSPHTASVYDDIPEEVLAYLELYMNRCAKTYNEIAEEWQYYEGYQASWAIAPYDPTFVTCDAVVTNAAHVLLVTRKDRPGKGLLALPGGFVHKGKTLKGSMLEELKEETKIKVPESVLRGSIKSHREFDNPTRSLRGRVITHAYHIALDEPTLPKVRGGDDAAKARWVPLGQIQRDQLFEDHFDIIETMVGV